MCCFGDAISSSFCSRAQVCGIAVAALAYISLTRLDVLSVDSQRWGLHEHQRSLVYLGMAEIVVGSALTLASLLGCFDVLVAKKSHRVVSSNSRSIVQVRYRHILFLKKSVHSEIDEGTVR